MKSELRTSAKQAAMALLRRLPMKEISDLRPSPAMIAGEI